jgi:hypothetical protein
MKRIVALGFGFSVAAVLACSSSGTSSLSGQASQASGDGGSGSCGTMGTAVADGAGYVQAEGCESCHGANLAGRLTPLVSGEEPGLVIVSGHLLYPPNLTPDPTTGLGDWTDAQINLAITEGIDNLGLDLCPEMGRHYPDMCPDEVTGIIAYLRSIPAVTQKVPESICGTLKPGPDDGG